MLIKMRVLENFKKEKESKVKTHRRIFSRVIAKQYLRNIKNNTMNYVEGNGFFRNVIDFRLSSELMPDLYLETSKIALEDAKLN